MTALRSGSSNQDAITLSGVIDLERTAGNAGIEASKAACKVR